MRRVKQIFRKLLRVDDGPIKIRDTGHPYRPNF
jgi:hypothetical protein